MRLRPPPAGCSTRRGCSGWPGSRCTGRSPGPRRSRRLPACIPAGCSSRPAGGNRGPGRSAPAGSASRSGPSADRPRWCSCPGPGRTGWGSRCSGRSSAAGRPAAPRWWRSWSRTLRSGRRPGPQRRCWRRGRSAGRPGHTGGRAGRTHSRRKISPGSWPDPAGC